ncbi:hypothetical protein C8Q72DRAFT_338044, partial [Fomitopsis betulina]
TITLRWTACNTATGPDRDPTSVSGLPNPAFHHYQSRLRGRGCHANTYKDASDVLGQTARHPLRHPSQLDNLRSWPCATPSPTFRPSRAIPSYIRCRIWTPSSPSLRPSPRRRPGRKRNKYLPTTTTATAALRSRALSRDDRSHSSPCGLCCEHTRISPTRTVNTTRCSRIPTLDSPHAARRSWCTRIPLRTLSLTPFLRSRLLGHRLAICIPSWMTHAL